MLHHPSSEQVHLSGASSTAQDRRASRLIYGADTQLEWVLRASVYAARRQEKEEK